MKLSEPVKFTLFMAGVMLATPVVGGAMILWSAFVMGIMGKIAVAYMP